MATSSQLFRTPIALVVEDQPIIRMELADALVRDGWDVVELASGEDAFAYLAEAEITQLLVTDIQLGGKLNGWDVAERCRSTSPACAVIYYSDGAIEKARCVPGSFFLSKPSELDALVQLGNTLSHRGPEGRRTAV